MLKTGEKAMAKKFYSWLKDTPHNFKTKNFNILFWLFYLNYFDILTACEPKDIPLR